MSIAVPQQTALAPPRPVPPLRDDTSEVPRLAINALIIIASFGVVLWTLSQVFGAEALREKDTKVLSASTVVAIVGAVTTFLGTAVGVFFGVNVGQAGAAAANHASISSANAASAANNAATSAQQAGNTAANASATANNAISTAQGAATAAGDANAKLGDVGKALAALVQSMPEDTFQKLTTEHQSALRLYVR